MKSKTWISLLVIVIVIIVLVVAYRGGDSQLGQESDGFLGEQFAELNQIVEEQESDGFLGEQFAELNQIVEEEDAALDAIAQDTASDLESYDDSLDDVEDVTSDF